jgi:hypothetical protein
MAANSLLDRGWGKAAQLVAVDGEIRQLVEVKLSVVQAPAASHALPSEPVLEIEAKEIDSYEQTSCVRNSGSGDREPK